MYPERVAVVMGIPIVNDLKKSYCMEPTSENNSKRQYYRIHLQHAPPKFQLSLI